MAKNKKKKNSGGNGVHALSDEQFVRQRARLLPIGDCFMTEGAEKCGIATIAVIRNHPQGKVTGAVFLVDFYCLGVKDALVFVREDWEDLKERFYYFDGQNDEVKKISYEEAHNRIYGAIAFAEEAGIKPCKEFSLAKYILEEDTDDIPLIEYEFGQNGKHMLFAKNRLELTTYLPTLRKNLGDDFSYCCPEDLGAEEEDFEDEEDGFEDEEDEERWAFFGYGVYPSTYKLRIKGLIALLEAKDGEGKISEENLKKLLANNHDTLREDIYNLLAFTKGMAEEEDEDLTDEEYDDIKIGEDAEPETFMIINAISVLMHIGFGDKYHIINDWFDSSAYILDKYFGRHLRSAAMSFYSFIAMLDIDYVCTLAKNYGLWTIESDTSLLTALGFYLTDNPEAKEKVIDTYRARLDKSIASAMEEIEDEKEAYITTRRAVTTALASALFGLKELIPNIKEAYDLNLVPKEVYDTIENDIHIPSIEQFKKMLEDR